MAEITTSNDGKELLSLCRAGRLYEIEKWIADGKSLEIHTPRNARKKTLLQVEMGFHSLVELVAKHDSDRSSKNAALDDAVSLHRLDLIELLAAQGAEIGSVPLSEVLLSWEPKIFQFFLSRGADPISGSPFAIAFSEKVRTALRPFLELKQSRPELAAALQQQLDCALRHFCSEGDLKWVSLLIWAGGDPRLPGPTLKDEYTQDPECYTSGVTEACYGGHVDVMKRLKIHKDRDDLSKLLHCVVISGKQDALQYLLDLGAHPNDKENGGSSALDSALWHLNTFNFQRNDLPRSKYSVWKELNCIGLLLAHGAVWNPDQSQVNSLRRILLESQPDVTIELLQLFRKHSACPAERVHKLLSTPRIKEHLAPQAWHISRLGLTLDDKRSPRERHGQYGRMRRTT